MQTPKKHSKTSVRSKKSALRVPFQLLLITIGLALSVNAQEQITLTASDGVKLYADFYPVGSNSQPYILLFHQAGSNRGEYAPIAPRLFKLGFNCLAIEQRSGGDLRGQQNETVRPVGHNGEYLDVLKDMEAALAWWARSSGNNGKVLLRGSRYSAALVFDGSSTLCEDTKRAGEPEIWRAAEEFLAGFEPRKSRTEGIPRAVNAVCILAAVVSEATAPSSDATLHLEVCDI
jgi:predicted alpha/beta hydrolase